MHFLRSTFRTTPFSHIDDMVNGFFFSMFGIHMIRISFLLPFECLNGFSYCWWWWFVFRMLTAEAMCCYYWCYSIVPSDRHIVHTHTQVVPQRRNGPVQRMEKEWIKCSFTIYYSNDRWWQEFDIKQILILYGIIDCIANANANAKRVNMTTIKSRCMAFHFMLFYSTSVHFCVCAAPGWHAPSLLF